MLTATADAGCCYGSCFPEAAGRGSEASNVIPKFTLQLPGFGRMTARPLGHTASCSLSHKPDVARRTASREQIDVSFVCQMFDTRVEEREEREAEYLRRPRVTKRRRSKWRAKTLRHEALVALRGTWTQRLDIRQLSMSAPHYPHHQ